jgi:hypothetical protein
MSARDNGITNLNVAKSRALVRKNRGTDLELDALSEITPGVAKSLAEHDSSLSLNGLTTLSVEVAIALAGHGHPLCLGGVTKLSDDAAEALSGHRGQCLVLQNLTELSSLPLARAMKDYDVLYLDNVTVLSLEAAEELASGTARLCLRGLKSISGQIAQALARKRKGRIQLEGLVDVPETAADALRGNHNVSLPDRLKYPPGSPAYIHREENRQKRRC